MLRRFFVCRWARRLLSPRLDGQLRPRASLWLEGHLKRCPDCQRRFDALRRSQNALRLLPALEPSPSWALSLAERLARTEPPLPSLWQRSSLRLRGAFQGIELAWVVTVVLCLLTTLAISIWSFCAPAPPLPPSVMTAEQSMAEEGE